VIVVDASALLAVFFREPERERFIEAMRRAAARQMSPVNFWEAFVRVRAADGPKGAAELDVMLANLAIEIVPIDEMGARLAVDAFARYGKRTPANLNLGDCFAYALAKQRNAPLLYKGDDFAQTDIVAA